MWICGFTHARAAAAAAALTKFCGAWWLGKTGGRGRGRGRARVYYILIRNIIYYNII
jgi:hypothetical protein